MWLQLGLYQVKSLISIFLNIYHTTVVSSYMIFKATWQIENRLNTWYCNKLSTTSNSIQESTNTHLRTYSKVTKFNLALTVY